MVSFASFVFIARTASAQMTGAPTAGYRPPPGPAASTMPAALREIGFDQKIGEPLPLDVPLVDEAGRHVSLGGFFGTRPVVLLFAYYDCPMLCSLVMNGLATALDILSLDAGRDFEVVVVSFDPRDTPATATAKKTSTLARYRRQNASAGWHFLVGDDVSIRRVTTAAGFRFAWDADTRQFAHPSGVIVATPDGRLARYLFGIEYGPRDLQLAVVEASDGKVGSPVDALLLYCYHYDPTTGKYGLAIMRAIRVGGAATLFALVAFIVVAVRRERRAGGTVPGTRHPAPGTRQPERGPR